MNRLSTLFAAAAVVFTASCAVSVNDPDYTNRPGSNRTPNNSTTLPNKFSFNTATLFPFENSSNWWDYSEPGGNRLRIAVTDTISDDDVTYYRVSFMEHRVDTTDDWFQQSSNGVLFGTSLTGTYTLFLPARLSSPEDTFSSRSQSVSWHYEKTTDLHGTAIANSVTLKYTTPVIHGFDEIVLADSLGIIKLIDYDGRWKIDYTLDSCSIDDRVTVF